MYDEENKSLKEKIIEVITGKSAFLFFFGIIFVILAQILINFEIISFSFIILGALLGIGGIIRFFNEQEDD